MPSDPPAATGPFSKARFRFTSGVRAGEVVAIRDESGETLLTYRSFASVVGIVGLVVSVIEESLSRALLRKAAGKFNRRYESNVRIRYFEKNVGWIIRRPDENGEVDVLDAAGDIDRRIAVALATLILGSEP